MPKIGISTGIGPDTLTGDSLLVGAGAINNNFNEIYDYFGDGSNLFFVGSAWKTNTVGLSTTKSVGINTESPTSSFHVVGNSLFSGIVTASSFVGNLTGTATTSNNLSNAANITTGIISQSRLTGTYNIDISGIAANASFASQANQSSLSNYAIIAGLATQATFSDLAGISTYSNLSGISSYSEISGISTYSLLSGVSTYSNTSGIASLAIYAATAGIATLGSNYANISGVSTYSQLAGISSFSNTSGQTSYANLSGVSTYSQISGFSTYSGVSGVSSALQNSRSFSITGNFITASSISFDGTSNVALSATITADSIQLGTYTSGNYVKQISNGSYITGADGGNEGSVLSIGVDATSSNTASKVVARDGSGDFSARIITANLTGTATTATNLSNAGNITAGTISNDRLSGSYNIDITGSSASSSYSSSSGVSTSSSSSNYSQISGVSTYSNSSGVSTYSNLSGVSTYSSLSGISTYSRLSGVSTNVIGGISSVTSLIVSGISTFNGISTHTQPIFGTTLTLSGNVLANSFSGSGIGLTNVPAESLTGTILPPLDGSNLYNINGLGNGVQIWDDNTIIGTASTINFGNNLSVSFSSGIATITASGSGGSVDSLWTKVNSGIYTSFNVGIGTTNPTSELTVYGNAFITGTISGLVNYASISGVSTYSDISGVSTYSNLSGVSTYSNLSGVSTYSNLSGVSTYSDISGVSTYSNLSGVSTYSTYSESSGISSYSDYSNYSEFSGLSTNSYNSEFSLYSEVSGISSGFDGFYGTIDYLNVGKNATITSNLFDTAVNIFHTSTSPVINVYNQTTDTSTLKITQLGLVGIGSSDPTSKLTVDGNVKISGIITAGVFIGDGSGLTGIVAQGSGIIVRDDNTLIGTASTINFGDNLSVSQISSGIVTVSSPNPWSLSVNGIYNTQLNVGIGTSVPSSKLHVLGNLLVSDGNITGDLSGNASSSDYSQNSGVSTNSTNSTNVIGGIGSISTLDVSGITTLSSLRVGSGGTIVQTSESGFVGINSSVPRETLDVSGKLFVKSYSLNTGVGTFNSSSGVPVIIDTFKVQSGFEDFKTVEYTINVGYGTNIQTQKVLAIQNGITAYSQEYAIIYHPNLIVSVASTIVISGADSFFTLQLIPESGISGLTTYRFVRGGLL